MIVKIKLKNCLAHFLTISKHKLIVTQLCFKLGLFRQGILHDLSKYSPVEFLSGATYYQGHRSPIDYEKENLGYSLGWLHHKGRNKHHWEYWTDKNKNGICSIQIPVNYVKEMACDRIAASMIYQGKNYEPHYPLTYFQQGTDRLYMHENTAKFLEKMLFVVSESSLNDALSHIKKMTYDSL